MKKIIPFLIMTFFWSCSNGDMTAKIAELEKAHAETPTTEIKKELLASYTTYLNELKDDANSYSQFAHKKAMLEMDLNQYDNANLTLTTAIQNHPTGTSSNENIGLLSSVLVNHVHASKFESAIEDFKKLYPDPATVKNTFSPIIKSLGETMFDTKTGNRDRIKVRNFISLARIQAGIVKNDDEVQKSLFSAAEMSNSIKNYKQTLAIYDYIIAHPNNFSKAPTALFLKGFTYDEHLKNLEEAKKHYTEYLEKHPEGGYAESAQASLRNLGKSAEEIIQSFGK
ncbi:MAG: tol-pal system YbgF family protein [Saprospiraceae bacterium]